MIIYLAGCPKFTRGISHRLLSFYDKPKLDDGNYKKLFLDSGAFSAWSKGKEIDLNNYSNFIKKNRNKITIYANLDVIGNVKDSWINQLELQKLGLSPLPVFHAEDPIKYLKRAAKKYEYICLGGMARRFNKFTKIEFLRRCFEILDYENIKVHGFGITDIYTMESFNWYSVDSSSWVMQAATGNIFVPFQKNNLNVHLSSKNGIEVTEPKKRNFIENYVLENGLKIGKSEFKNVSEDYIPNNELEKIIKTRHGYILEKIIEKGVINDFYERAYLNVLFFKNLEKSLQYKPKQGQKNLFT